MKRKSDAGRIIHKTAADIRPPTNAELARLRSAMNARIDTSDIPPRQIPPRYPLVRSANARIPRKPPSVIRDAILEELGRRGMSRYELWRRARRYCSTLPNSAVYEFLLGQRAISVAYCDAMLKALDLGVKSLRKSA